MLFILVLPTTTQGLKVLVYPLVESMGGRTVGPVVKKTKSKMCNVKLLFDILKHCQTACPLNFHNVISLN